MSPAVLSRLLELGIDPRKHLQRKIQKEILDQADLVVAMGFDHRDYLSIHFGRKAWLFNQICFGKDEPILDVWEAVPNWQNNEAAKVSYAVSVVGQIHDAIPYFVANVESYL